MIFRNVIRSYMQSAEIGWQLFNPYWGKGYGQEMVKGSINLAFKQLKLYRIEGAISPLNKRSIKLAKAIGMRREGISKKRIDFGDGRKDMAMFAITQGD